MGLVRYIYKIANNKLSGLITDKINEINETDFMYKMCNQLIKIFYSDELKKMNDNERRLFYQSFYGQVELELLINPILRQIIESLIFDSILEKLREEDMTNEPNNNFYGHDFSSSFNDSKNYEDKKNIEILIGKIKEILNPKELLELLELSENLKNIMPSSKSLFASVNRLDLDNNQKYLNFNNIFIKFSKKIISDFIDDFFISSIKNIKIKDEGKQQYLKELRINLSNLKKIVVGSPANSGELINIKNMSYLFEKINKILYLKFKTKSIDEDTKVLVEKYKEKIGLLFNELYK